MESLQRQLVAMETAFTLQEQALATPVAAAAATTVARITDKAAAAQWVADFPFHKLLGMWRRTALKELLHRRIADSSLQKQLDEGKAERYLLAFINTYCYRLITVLIPNYESFLSRAGHQRKVQELEGLCAGWRERGTATQSMARSLRQDLETAESAKTQAELSMVSLQQQLNTYRAALGSLR